MKAKIYTRKGDLGETGFLDGKRVPKNNPRVEAVGGVDEVNTQLGLAIAQIQDTGYRIQVRKKDSGKWKEEIVSKLVQIQNDLFVIGSLIAGYEPSAEQIAVSRQRLEERVVKMEEEIDEMWEKLPQLANFILPGGSIPGAQLHVARAVCRRLERRLVSVPIIHNTYPIILVYVNRLSDYLFCLARWVNFKSKREEVVWRNTS